ncbi:hypothetical protein H105_05932 [Trichophyton soudanense CBS 452.61]|uniref:F-box domain-containing protein n=1 Tax=Trichophyton soudanense CBS 452.61 TaxID=1215331 RepID=A0A022XNK5_TRISD|nr:hypothetical protein H105_05932 [Trichophyton soudanense CBS 452.61]
MTVPILYRNINLYIPPEDEPGKYLDTKEPPWLNCFRSIARNKSGQAEWVRTIAVRGARRNSYETFPRVGAKESTVPDVARLNSERIQLHKLLSTLFTKMKKLQSFCWTADCLYPTKEVFKLQENVKVFIYLYPRALQNARKDKVLSDAYPEIRHASFKCLKELSIFDIPYLRTLNHISKILVEVRGTIRVLRLGLIKEGDRFRALPQMYKTSSAYSQDLLLTVTKGLSKFSKTDGFVRLHTLEILFCNHLVIQAWAQIFDFTAIKSFSLIHSFHFGVHYPSPWTYLQSRRVTLKRLKTNIYVTGAVGYLQSFNSLEELYLIGSPEYLDFGALRFHFSNLRAFLCLEYVTHLRFFVRNIHLLIAGCPKLEELGIPLPRKIQSTVWSVLAHAPALRCLYFIKYNTGRIGSLQALDPFIFEFFGYFELHPSPLIYRLEMLSCHKTLWRLSSLASAPVQRRTHEEIWNDIDCWCGYEPFNTRERANTRPEPLRFGNFGPGLDRVAIRVRWEDYLEDEMISTIRNYLLPE